MTDTRPLSALAAWHTEQAAQAARSAEGQNWVAEREDRPHRERHQAEKRAADYLRRRVFHTEAAATLFNAAEKLEGG